MIKLTLYVLGLARGVLAWVIRKIRCLATAGITWHTHRVDAPLVRSLEDLQICNHNVVDDDGHLKFSYSTVSFTTKEHTVYYGRSRIRKLTREIANESLEPVPDKDIYPEAPSHITRARTIDGNCFIKGLALRFYEELGGSGIIAQILMCFIFKRPGLDPLTPLLSSFRVAIEKNLATSGQPLLIHRVIVMIDPTLPSLVHTNLGQNLMHQFDTLTPTRIKTLLLRPILESERKGACSYEYRLGDVVIRQILDTLSHKYVYLNQGPSAIPRTLTRL